jgi:hypothetical protein
VGLAPGFLQRVAVCAVARRRRLAQLVGESGPVGKVGRLSIVRRHHRYGGWVVKQQARGAPGWRPGSPWRYDAPAREVAQRAHVS